MLNAEEVETNKEKYKIIQNACDARALLKMGHSIVDIKPKKGHLKETVFVFAVDDQLFADIDSIESPAKEETH